MHISFWPVFIGLEFLVLLQAWLASSEDYLLQEQRWTRKQAYTLSEHGGWWTDMLLISPVFAWVASKNEVNYTSDRSVGLLLLATGIWFFLILFYAKQSRKAPEAHCYGGRTTSAGWVHAIYAVIVTWFAGLYYFGGFPTVPTGIERLAMFGTCWVLVVIGGVKFSYRWRWTWSTTIQALAVLLVLLIGEGHLSRIW